MQDLLNNIDLSINDRTTQYAVDVLNDKIVAGLYVRLACLRHINDLEKSKSDDFEYEFNVEKATCIIDFAETLIITEGQESFKVTLFPFQCFILGSLNGWVHKKTGYRRFRHSYVQLARQNGKSLLNGILATYYGNFDGYNNPQIYLTATKLSQAEIVYNETCKFIKGDSDLQELFTIRESYSDIKCLVTDGFIKCLSRDTNGIDGFRPLLGVCDELHKHPNNQMYKQLEGGTRNMNESLISAITTAGFDLNNCYCYELYEYCVGTLQGLYDNDKQFIYIAQMDEDDDIWDSKNWIKCNPMIGNNAEKIYNMEQDGKKAKDIGGQDYKDFLVKALNIWTEFSENQYLERENIKNCMSDLTLEDFRGKKCNIGLDLSSGGDLTSLALIFDYRENNETNYFIHSHSFMPEKRLDEHIKSDSVPYDLWKKKGLLTTTGTNGGIKNDYEFIISYLKDLIKEYDLHVSQVGYDQRNADMFLNKLNELGYPTVEIYQSHKWLNDPTEDFRLNVKSGLVKFNKEDELLAWSLANAKTVSNSDGLIKIDKEKSNQRIDTVDAIIDAYKLAYKAETLVDYNEYLNQYFEKMGIK